jgi:hypothetical protein
LGARYPKRFAGRLADGQKCEAEHCVIVEEAFARRFALKEMVAETATLFIEGVLPEDLAGTARGRNPFWFAKDPSCVRKSSDCEAVEGNDDLVIACRLPSPIPHFDQLCPHGRHLGILSARPALFSFEAV